MRVLTGWIQFLEEDHGDDETCAIVEHASWEDMTEEELNNFGGDWITEGYKGTIKIISYEEGFFK